MIGVRQTGSGCIGENPPPSQGLRISAVHYQVRNGAGTIAVGDTRISGAVTEQEVVVPAPGAYKAEVWLEDTIVARALQPARPSDSTTCAPDP